MVRFRRTFPVFLLLLCAVIAPSDAWGQFPESLEVWVFADFTIVDTNLVPEPSTIVLLALGCLGLLVYRRRR